MQALKAKGSLSVLRPAERLFPDPDLLGQARLGQATVLTEGDDAAADRFEEISGGRSPWPGGHDDSVSAPAGRLQRMLGWLTIPT